MDRFELEAEPAALPCAPVPEAVVSRSDTERTVGGIGCLEPWTKSTVASTLLASSPAFSICPEHSMPAFLVGKLEEPYSSSLFSRRDKFLSHLYIRTPQQANAAPRSAGRPKTSLFWLKISYHFPVRPWPALR